MDGDIRKQEIQRMPGDACYVIWKIEKAVACQSGQRQKMLLIMQNKFSAGLILAHTEKRRKEDPMNKSNHTYQFTLILDNVDEFTEELEDMLYEAGCDDALINFRNGTVYLDFDRKARSLKEAVISAIKQVESSQLNIVVGAVAPDNFVTESEVAERLSIKRQAVSLWIKGQRRASTPFPSPKLKLSNKSPLWKWNEVAEWLYTNQIIKEKKIVDVAIFIEDINAALEERNTTTRKHRQELVEKLTINLKSRDNHAQAY